MIKIKILIVFIAVLFNVSAVSVFASSSVEAALEELRQELAEDKKAMIKEFKEYKQELAQVAQNKEAEFKEQPIDEQSLHSSVD